MSTQPTYPSAPTPQQETIVEPALKRALYGRKSIGAPRRYNLYALYRVMLVGGGVGLCGSFGRWFCVVAASLVGGASFCVVVVLSSFVSLLGCVV